MKHLYQIVFIVALIVGIGGRLWGAWVNNESNDNHVQVVQRILAGDSIAHKDSCWECFQPPLFYSAHAGLSTITGADSRRELIQQMQLVSALMTLLVIYLVFLAVRDLYGRGTLTKMIVAFCLLNPALFAMGIQGTNDTPVILLATCSAALLLRYMRVQHTRVLLLMGITALMAAFIKGSGLAIFLMFSTWLILLAVKHKRYIAILVPAIGLILLTTNSQYRHSYEQYGNAFETNLFKPSPPPFFDDGKEFYARPGITSVWNSFGKFRFISMLQTPYNINTNDGHFYPQHRTSFWSQMYGSFLDSQFLQHPYSWENKHPDRLNMVRVLFVLGLLLIVVFGMGLFNVAIDLFTRRSWLTTDFVFLSLVLGMLFFGIKYAYDYRDFGCIKATFLLPVVLPMVVIFKRGWTSIRSSRISKISKFAVLLILAISAIDLIVLVSQLTLIAYGYIVIV